MLSILSWYDRISWYMMCWCCSPDVMFTFSPLCVFKLYMGMCWCYSHDMKGYYADVAPLIWKDIMLIMLPWYERTLCWCCSPEMICWCCSPDINWYYADVAPLIWCADVTPLIWNDIMLLLLPWNDVYWTWYADVAPLIWCLPAHFWVGCSSPSSRSSPLIKGSPIQPKHTPALHHDDGDDDGDDDYGGDDDGYADGDDDDGQQEPGTAQTCTNPESSINIFVLFFCNMYL